MTSDIVKKIRHKALQSSCRVRVAALGFNSEGVCVIARTNKPRLNIEKKGGSFHAERLIFNRARSKGVVKILICRVGNGGALRKIDPCPTCKAIARRMKIKIESINESI